jgi:glycosyltransferase involved in cell wall biosynthesis
MRIGVNALYLIPGRVGGTEIYLRNTLAALAAVDFSNEYLVFRNAETGPGLTPRATNFHDCPQPFHASFRPARILYEQLALPFALARKKIDVLFNAGFTAPLLWPGPMVTVFHDFQHKRHPEFFRWFDLPFWRFFLWASAARSRRIVVLSGAVRSDLERFFHYPSARIDLIPHALEPEFSRIAERRSLAPAHGKRILSVSTLHPHKNVDGLLGAFRCFIDLHPGWSLCLVGLKGFDAKRIEALRADLGLHESVTITGWIEREELYELFASAAAFVYPSRFEGFGIPVLEALAAGLPVACSRLPSLVEIANGNGEEAARFFDPDRIPDIVAALVEITSNEELRARLRDAGLRRARDFSPENSARKLVAAFEKAARNV